MRLVFRDMVGHIQAFSDMLEIVWGDFPTADALKVYAQLIFPILPDKAKWEHFWN